MRILIMILLSVYSNFSLAVTGLELLNNCKNKENCQRYNYCLGYVSGIYEGLGYTAFADPNYKRFCPPKVGITTEELSLIVIKYLESIPQDLHMESGIHVILAFEKAYPCNVKTQ